MLIAQSATDPPAPPRLEARLLGGTVLCCNGRPLPHSAFLRRKSLQLLVPTIFAHLLQRVAAAGRYVAKALRRHLRIATKPAAAALVVGTLADPVRSKPELMAENALLRQHVIVLRRGDKRPRCTPTAHPLVVLPASRLCTWRTALLIVQPDTLLRWHQELFRRYWRRKSHVAAPAHRPPIAPETVVLIREMAGANRTWGAERIRGELRKLNIRFAKSTFQRYMRGIRSPRRSGQKWSPFLANHGKDIWAADCVRTAYRAPKENAICERFLGSVRRECLDHLLNRTFISTGYLLDR